MQEYVSQKVEDWVAQVVQLAEFAKSQPQAAFIFGLRHTWTYFQRTLPDVDELLEPLERAVADSLIPSITNHNCSNEERNLLSLPVRFVGMGITNPNEDAASQYTSSVVSTTHLTERIVAQIHNPPDAEDVRSSISHSRKEKNDQFIAKSTAVKNYLPESTKRAVDLAMEKGASSWLTAIPIKDLGFDLNKAQAL